MSPNKNRKEEQSNRKLNRFSSSQDRRAAADAMFDSFSEMLFERVNLINGTFIVSQSTTSQTNYTLNVRVLDSSERVFMRPDRKIRMRCSLYMGGAGADKADFYIMVPAVLTDTASITFSDPHRYIASVESFDSFAGIRFNAGVTTLESWDGSSRRTRSTDFVLSGDTTIYLEIMYNIASADFYIDNNFIGSISTNLTNTIYTYRNFYPLIAPTRSADGSSVNLNLESYQILQDK